MSIVIFILILTFLILIHELGHFLTALLFKVRILEFGLGIPPKVHTLFHWRGIPFTLNALPLGGFVRMEGEDGSNGKSEEQETLSKEDLKLQKDAAPLYAKPAWQRLIIILAGATVNFVFGVLAFAGIFSVVGIPEITKLDQVTVQYVSPNSPAQAAGIKEGDRLLSVSDPGGEKQTVTTSEQFVSLMRERWGKEVVIGYTRDGQEQTVTVKLRTAEEIPSGDGALGVAASEEEEKLVRYPWYEMPFRGMYVGLLKSLSFGELILRSLTTMVTDLFAKGVVPKDVAGPIGIADQVQKENLFAQGPLVAINFAAMLSVNLAIMNVLPIPALDGGRAFFILLEKLIGKKLVAKFENSLNTAGFVFLIALLLLITFKDVITIFRS